jgi:ADP-heptose:LPS heptosyltransferase
MSQSLPTKRILLIPLRFIGDTILTVPLIRAIAHQYPHAQLDVMVSPTAYPLLENCPYIHKLLIEEKSFWKQLTVLQKATYSSVFILRKSATMALLCQLAGIPVRVGYDKQRLAFLGYRRWGLFLTQTARYPGLKTTTPQAISHQSLLQAIQPENSLATAEKATRNGNLELWFTEADQAAVFQLLDEQRVIYNKNHPKQKHLAVFHATSASHGKQISPDKFLMALEALTEKGFQIICTGTSQDYLFYQHFAQKHNLPLINLAGKTTLRQTYCLYTMVQLLLTVDSSPVHLGSAAAVPNIVTVFGPTNVLQWGAYNPATQFIPVFMDLPCRPCYAKVCEHNNCKVQITGLQILNAVSSVFSIH